MTIGQRIQKLRGKLSRKDFARSLGIHPQTLYMYEKGKRNVDADFIKIFCENHHVSAEWLIFGKGTPPGAEDTSSVTAQGLMLEVPVVGLAACAQSGWFNPGPIALRAALPVEMPNASGMFAVIACGTSMQPEGIRQGYLLFCDPQAQPARGDAVFVERTDDTASVKRYLSADEEWVHLQGWLEPNEDGDQKPYTEKVTRKVIKRLACVVVVRRKA